MNHSKGSDSHVNKHCVAGSAIAQHAASFYKLYIILLNKRESCYLFTLHAYTLLQCKLSSINKAAMVTCIPWNTSGFRTHI